MVPGIGLEPVPVLNFLNQLDFRYQILPLKKFGTEPVSNVPYRPVPIFGIFGTELISNSKSVYEFDFVLIEDFWNDGIRKGLCCKSNVGKWPIS
ncbi:hypothetical protein HanIR_Chr06g0282331 [Helianthus annuus]|nr:hypothetical protein HanIR_Chr06g0282331 [Helianthus annuus]